MYLFTKKQKIISIVKNLKNDSVSLFLLAFKDKINVIEDYNNIMPLKEFCADNFIEIISGIFDKDIDQGLKIILFQMMEY